MKIAIFTDTFSPQINGVTKSLEKMVEYFQQNGIELLVFAPESPGNKKITIEKNIERLLSLPFVLYPELRISLPNYLKTRTRLRRFDPDIIHLVTPFNLGLLGLKYARSNDIPFVSSYHTNFNQYLNYYNLNILENPAWNYLKWFHNQSLTNFCPSEDTLEELKSKGFNNLNIWKRGIDTDLFSPVYQDQELREKYSLKDKIVLLYVGRVAPEKNLKLLLYSLKRLNSRFQDKITLLITGSGPSLKNLKKKAPENVIFTGYKTGRDLSKIYASADIFVFPSVTETYGNVVIEAMASGLPVLGILAGGVKENLIDEYNGLACQENSKSEFTFKLERLILDNDLRNKLACNARQHALKLSWDKIFKNLLVNYQEVIDDKKLLHIETA